MHEVEKRSRSRRCCYGIARLREGFLVCFAHVEIIQMWHGFRNHCADALQKQKS
jgi:hypothetical protein